MRRTECIPKRDVSEDDSGRAPAAAGLLSDRCRRRQSCFQKITQGIVTNVNVLEVEILQAVTLGGYPKLQQNLRQAYPKKQTFGIKPVRSML